jgi:adenylosuccinate lyase
MNLMMPGNPRYQPQSLVPYFGYDNTMRSVGEVEIATMQVLGDIGVIPTHEIALLTPEIIEGVLSISTTEVDRIERAITKHDIRAWVHMAKLLLPEPLHKWVHVPLTSYDPLDTGRVLIFIRAYKEVIRPKINEVVKDLSSLVRKFAGTIQIGRTHGQHALPITAGFWLATILNRILVNAEEVSMRADGLVGKVSGAVGAYNAQVGLGIEEKCGSVSFEARVLKKLGLRPAKISTQILQPEPLVRFLHDIMLLTGAIGQFGRDCRHLMRSEIAEVAEEFEEGQEGSSTMVHKRNPITFEQFEGRWIDTKNEYMKVLDTVISEHQRDLVGSSVARNFPVIPINLTVQLDALLKRNKKGVPFLQRLTINEQACLDNFNMSANLVLAEPMYLALQMAGYAGDAHKLINHKAVPKVKKQGGALIDAVAELAEEDEGLRTALDNIPPDVKVLLHNAKLYTGKATAKAIEIADAADAWLTKIEN